VYRGKALPELVGKYIYSDWPSGRVWALDGSTPKTIADNGSQRIPMAIAEDNDGEVYVLHFDGIAKQTCRANVGRHPLPSAGSLRESLRCPNAC
jgi:hypothetical protein